MVDSTLRNHLALLDVNAHNLKVIDRYSGKLQLCVENIGHPDGIQVDRKNHYFYWTDMGPDRRGEDFIIADGGIWRCDFDGSNIVKIAGNGDFYTPKQLQLDQTRQQLYWCDREGGRVMRCNTDGSDLTILIESAQHTHYPRDKTEQCVGIALDYSQKKIYWSQKGPQKGGQGRIFRANLELPAGLSPWERNDIELLADHLPEPIDLEIDPINHYLYWTDRGSEPDGNSLNRAQITKTGLGSTEILIRGFHEAIGLALDIPQNLAYVSDLSGRVYQIDLMTLERSEIYHDGIFVTGIALF